MWRCAGLNWLDRLEELEHAGGGGGAVGGLGDGKEGDGEGEKKEGEGDDDGDDMELEEDDGMDGADDDYNQVCCLHKLIFISEVLAFIYLPYTHLQCTVLFESHCVVLVAGLRCRRR